MIVLLLFYIFWDTHSDNLYGKKDEMSVFIKETNNGHENNQINKVIFV